MSGRIEGAILGANRAYSVGRQGHILDLRYGGQLGTSNRLREFLNSTLYIRKNLQAIVIETPKLFKFFEDPEYYIGATRALFETHCLTIDGFVGDLTVETADTPLGGAGEVLQVPIDVKRARSNPVTTLDEKYGLGYFSLFDNWIRRTIMDPDLKYATVTTQANYDFMDLLPDRYSATVMFYETDPNNKYVNKAFLTANMFPLMTGEYIGRREITAGGDKSTLSINWAGFTDQSEGARAFAQDLHDGIQLVNADPHGRKTFVDRILPEVSRAHNSTIQHMQELAADQVRA